MEVKNMATMEMTDYHSNEDSIVIIRAFKDSVSLCLSIITNGDIEIALSLDKCRLVIDELQKAVTIAEE